MTPIALVLVAWGCWQAVVLVDDATRRPTASTRGQHLYNGTFGQRTLCAAYLAMTAPLLVLIPDPLLNLAAVACYVWALTITCSWLAVLACAVGVAWVYPWALWISVPVLAIVAGSVALAERRKRAGHPSDGWVAYTVRGDSLDTLTCRVLTWIIMLGHLRAHLPWGRGPSGETIRDLLRWDARYRTTLIHGYAHNEPLQVIYEHGILGALALALLVCRVAPHLAIGDPWSAATLTGAVLACGTIVGRVAPLGATWLVVTAMAVSR